MGARGPQPNPYSVLNARGSKYAEASKAGAAIAPPGLPDKPEHLSEAVGEIWDRTIDFVSSMGILSRVDAVALERYCVLLVAWRRVAKDIEENGTIGEYVAFSPKDGGDPIMEEKIRPAVKAFDVLTTQLARAEASFGLTPSSRSRIVTPSTPQEKNGKRDYLRLAN